MWMIEEVPGYTAGTRYLVKNDNDGGYLSNNSPGGGALHFLIREEAQNIVDRLNLYAVR